MASQDIQLSVSHHVCVVIFGIGLHWIYCFYLETLPQLISTKPSIPRPTSDVVLWPYSAIGLLFTLKHVIYFRRKLNLMFILCSSFIQSDPVASTFIISL